MQCNIDRQGRQLRIALGVVTSLLGAGLLAAWAIGALAGEWAPWTGIAAMLSGAFMIFAGVIGWCATRAMGFKTPI